MVRFLGQTLSILTDAMLSEISITHGGEYDDVF
jgi:hypothetical protein